MNVGFCIDDMPELYTSFLSDSIWSWVDTIVSSDGMTGEPGTNAGRVDFSNCKDLNKESEGGVNISRGGNAKCVRVLSDQGNLAGSSR